MKLVVPIDLTLGVLFLAVVFRPKKPLALLRRDLAIVALIQFLILLVGVVLIYKARPLAVVHTFDTFHVLNEESFAVAGVDSAILEKQKPSGLLAAWRPLVAYVAVEGEEATFVTSEFMAELNGQASARFRSDQYRDLPTSVEAAAALLRGEIDKSRGCVRVKITSNYRSGDICYAPGESSFKDFAEL